VNGYRWTKGIWAHTRAICSLRTPSLAAETGLARPTLNLRRGGGFRPR
jgi:hypothetical protein